MRFVVDQCVPVDVARWLAREGHDAWTAYEAGLSDAADEDLIAYAHAKEAALVTTNRDCAQLARRLRSAAVVWLSVREDEARLVTIRAMSCLENNPLPNGRVLRVTKVAAPKLLEPLRLH